MPGNVLIGTASWTDPTLIKSRRFYPAGCTSAEDRLRYYADRFPLVEVNSSYYAMPSIANSELWVQRTPPDFSFNVKAFRLFTGHQTSPAVLPAPVRERLPQKLAARQTIKYADVPPELLEDLWQVFDDALAPLREAGKLGAVHFQFAPWLTCTKASRAHVAECRRRLPADTLSVEFRHMTWFDDSNRARTLAFERDHALVHTVIDGPQGFTNSVAQLWEVTQPLALVRLHGRNTATWATKSTVASERFNYDYSETELLELAAAVGRLSESACLVHVIFNNNNGDQGQRNASSLQRLMQSAA